ncbi:MAG TPA: heavy-metal-associated domain-containing protein [Burkholderiaceae bacterium]|jgi:copper chaperone|nr:heavy-metal-associated domain-containing protein [Burkholderiaceae bacterium]
MYEEFKLPDMTCGHCASRVTQALVGTKLASYVNIDLRARLIKVRSDEDRTTLAAALSEAGYPPA